MKTLVVLLCIFSGSLGFLFPHSAKWNNLKVTWGKYTSMPLTEADAKSQGYTKMSDCGDSSGLHGRRYVKNNDMTIILIYDVQGHIAGISAAVPKSSSFPSAEMRNHPFVLSGNNYHISVYFVDPAIICTTGRSNSVYNHQGVGTDLYLQNGTDPIAHSKVIPHQETGIKGTQWTLGKCFPTMGVHYWYNIGRDMSCDNFFPMFLLYNGGQLNAFGWAFATQLTSTHVEHPPKSSIGLNYVHGDADLFAVRASHKVSPEVLDGVCCRCSTMYSGFMKEIPQCLLNHDLSTQHIYLTNNPLTDTC